MATVPLNLFKNVTTPLSSIGSGVIYTAPVQRASIILATQIANITDQYQTVTALLSSVAFSTTTFLISGYTIPAYDAANIAMGKIILTEGDRLILYCSKDNSLHATLSILETINTST